MVLRYGGKLERGGICRFPGRLVPNSAVSCLWSVLDLSDARRPADLYCCGNPCTERWQCPYRVDLRAVGRAIDPGSHGLGPTLMINLTAVTRLMPMSGAGNSWQTGLAQRPCIGVGESAIAAQPRSQSAR